MTGVKDGSAFQYHLLSLPRGISRLEKLGKLKKVPKNFELNEIDQVPEYCYIVKSGRVISYEYTITGEQRVYNFMEPNSLFLEECLLFDIPCPVLFKTVVPSELISIEKCNLKRAFKRDIDAVMEVCQSLSTKFLSSMEHIRRGHYYDAAWKICKLLMIFAEHYGVPYDNKILINEKISQQMIADLLGMNRVTVTRKFKELRELALLEHINGYYCIRNKELLQKHMDCLYLESNAHWR